MPRVVLFASAWIALGLGVLGVFVPVFPTTPLVLLSGYLFAKSSPRCHAWLQRTHVYRAYVQPFQERGGIPFRRKVHILGLSFTVMAISAILVPLPIVWAVLGAVAVFLLWLMCVRIPTVGSRSSSSETTSESDGRMPGDSERLRSATRAAPEAD